MKIDTAEGATPAPDETDAVPASETSEPEVKDETDPQPDESEAETLEKADAEGEATKPPPAEAEKPETEERDDDAERQESKSQRKRRLRRERSEALEAELDRTQRELEAANRRIAALKDENPDAAENYQAAETQNVVNRTLRAQETARIEALKADKERVEREAQQAAKAAWDEQVAELTHITDFAQKVYADDVPFTTEIASAVRQMERGPEIAYALANDHERLLRMHRLGPVQLGAELARIEAGLSYPKPKTTTSAPKPLKPLKGSTTTPEKTLENADYESFKKMRGFG